MGDEENLDDVFEALGHRIRRNALAALADTESSLALADLAAETVAREQGDTIEALSDDLVSKRRHQLHHTHIPKLADLGFVEYDHERRVVTSTKLGEDAILVLERVSDTTDEVP